MEEKIKKRRKEALGGEDQRERERRRRMEGKKDEISEVRESGIFVQWGYSSVVFMMHYNWKRMDGEEEDEGRRIWKSF